MTKLKKTQAVIVLKSSQCR